MSTVTLKFHKTDSEFIEAVSHMIQGEEDGKDWYYMPFWFNKIDEGMYVQYNFEDLPQWLKDELKEFKNTPYYIEITKK